MRSSVAVALVAVCGLGLAAAEAPAISTDNLRTHLQFLSSDEMRGRANGSPELERAAEYIASQFESAGLRPGGVDGWFQPFEVIAGLIVGPGNELSISARGKTVRFALGMSYYPLGTPATGTPTRLEALDVVFAGYGISAPDANYDDYARLNVEGKAVVIFSHEPQERSTSSRLNGARPLAQTTLEAKAAAARGRGAKLLIVIGDPTHGIDQADYRPVRPGPRRRRDRNPGPPHTPQGGAGAGGRLPSRCACPPDRRRSGAPVRASAGSQDQLHRGSDEEPPHRPQRRRRVARKRSGPARAGHRHRRALRPRGHRRALVGEPGARRADSQRRRRQRVRHLGDHRNGPRGVGRPRPVSTVTRVRRLRRRGTRAPGLGPLHHRPADSHRLAPGRC